MREQVDQGLEAYAAQREDDEIRFLDVLIVLANHKWLVIGMPLFVGALAFAASFFITPTFTSTVKIMPPQQQQSSGVSAMLGQLGGLAGMAGGLGGLKNPSDLYVGLLESRTVADNLIVRFKLKERYDTATMDETRKALALATEITTGKKDGFIGISITDTDARFAADLANAYGDELSRLTQTMALTEASQRRLFFEKQLNTAKDQLADAEIALRTTQEKTGMISPGAQVQAIINNAAQLKGTIAAKEVQINAMRTFASGSNPDLIRALEELRSLQGQLSKLEKNGSVQGDFMVPTGNIPKVGVEYVRSSRNVKYYETIFELLAKQYELAKIDEAKDSGQIQMLDRAIPAEKRSKPQRGILAILGAVVGAMIGILLAFAHATYVASRKNPSNSRRWEQLAAEWNGRRAVEHASR